MYRQMRHRPDRLNKPFPHPREKHTMFRPVAFTLRAYTCESITTVTHSFLLSALRPARNSFGRIEAGAPLRTGFTWPKPHARCRNNTCVWERATFRGYWDRTARLMRVVVVIVVVYLISVLAALCPPCDQTKNITIIIITATTATNHGDKNNNNNNSTRKRGNSKDLIKTQKPVSNFQKYYIWGNPSCPEHPTFLDITSRTSEFFSEMTRISQGLFICVQGVNVSDS